MNVSRTADPSLALARALDAREITELAETYRCWQGVLAAAVDALHARGTDVRPSLAGELVEILAANGSPVPASDLEDAAMALWLHACGDRVDDPDAMIELLREPVRTFNSLRTADALRLTA